MSNKKTVLAGAGKGRSEEQISMHKFPTDFVKKALKEKSQSSLALKVGPFAAIKESEKRKKTSESGSLDFELEEENGGSGGGTRERAGTATGGGGGGGRGATK